jgi:protein involved in polysaccharide export with SLBB domain
LAAGLAVAALALAGCRVTGPTFNIRNEGQRLLGEMASVTNRIDPRFLRPPEDPFRLGPGDVIEIEFLDREGTRGSTFVGPDGKVYYDLLPGTDVWGLTLAEARAELEKGLTRYYKAPRLAVTLREVNSKRVWMMGRLNRTGVFPLGAPMTILEAIAHAGGLYTSRSTTEDLADLDHSFLVRRGELLPISFARLLRQGDMSQNVYLEPDDFVYLPSSLSKEIYVTGAVRSPRALAYGDSMTLATALAKSLGPNPEAYLQEVVVIRGSLSEPRVALVNFQAIVTGRIPDIQLQPRDIVFVPDKPYKTLERYANMALNAFVRTTAGNEGGRAGAAKFNNIGIVNPITARVA